MIVFLFHHNRWDNQYLLKKLGEENVRCVYSTDYHQWIMRHWRHFGGSLRAVRQSKAGDTIIAWHYLQAVLAWWICLFTFRQRNFVSLNVLLKIDKTLKNKLHRFLCKRAFLAKNFKATVNSEPYGSWLNGQLGINVQYTLLRDVYHDYYSFPQFVESKKQDVIFCGGASGRNWELMLQIVKAMPEWRFYMIMPGHEYSSFMRKVHGHIPSNVIIDHDLPYKDFLFRLCQSTLVVLPLSINAPAGLTVMFQAAGNRRMVITSNTAAMRGYFKLSQLCSNEVGDWCEKISYYMQHEKERNAEAERFHQFVTTKCSETQYAQTVKRLVEEFEC